MKRTYTFTLAFFALLALVLVACNVGNVFNFGAKPTAQTSQAALPTVPPAEHNAPQPTVAPSTGAQAAVSGASVATFQSELVNLYRKVSPGVVAIRVYLKQGGVQGSGFVFDKKGHIVTNYHVVADVTPSTKIEVDFMSGLKAWARVVGTDLDSDLAVLQVEDVPASKLHPLPLADSEKVQVGQIAVALGNPFGLKGTMTVGVVSALGRTMPSEHHAKSGGYFTLGDMIQTDAPINPGNSGGPLLNLKGEVIGVNRAIRTTNVNPLGEPTNSGIGFAIPSNIVKRVVPALITKGRYDYPYLGIVSVGDLTLEDVENWNLPQDTGAYIVTVVPGSPADKAGLHGAIPYDEYNPNAEIPAGGDLIVAVDGYPVREFNDLIHYLFTYTGPGDTVTLTVIRDGKKINLKLTLGKRPH